MIPFGEYTPDLAAFENPGLTDAHNVLPSTTVYLPVPSPVVFTTNGIDAQPQGAYSTRDVDDAGTTHAFVGNATKIYEITNAGSAFTDVSRVGGYTTGADGWWEFAQWGGQVVATNFADAIQVKTLSGGNFADLGGSPPKARHLGVVGQFLVLGNISDPIDGFQTQRVHWSGINDITSWTASSTTQAGFNDLRNDSGYVQRIIGGEYGIIFQERGITRMSYVGSPLVFQFDEVERTFGAFAAQSVIRVGNDVYYLADTGFFVFDGNQSVPIGYDKIDKTFFNDLQLTYKDTITACVFPREKIICWLYPGANGDPVGIGTRLLFFNYAPNSTKRWSYCDATGYVILANLSAGYTLDGLDAISTNLDTGILFSLDSPVWAGNIQNLGIIDADFKLEIFNGSAMTATIETGDAQLAPGQRTQVTLVRPYVDGSGTIQVQIGYRDALTTAVSYTTAAGVNSSGDIPVRSNGRYHRARVIVSGGFNNMQGFDVHQARTVGKR